MSKNAKDSEEKSKAHVCQDTKSYNKGILQEQQFSKQLLFMTQHSTRWSGQYEASDPGQEHRNH